MKNQHYSSILSVMLMKSVAIKFYLRRSSSLKQERRSLRRRVHNMLCLQIEILSMMIDLANFVGICVDIAFHIGHDRVRTPGPFP
jgi:hypothetical protein